MPHTKFEELIKKHEKDLQRIRNKYFSLVEGGIISGYNLYPSLFDYSKGRLFLNYLHSDLRLEDRHFKELSEILRTKGFLEERIIINDGLVDREETLEREANYITRASWEDPLNMRYFDFDGKELTREEAKALRRNIIGESFQYDLLLRIKDEPELRKVVDLFKEYASMHILDKNGRKIINNNNYVENENAIYNAWDTPLLICTSKSNKKPENLYDFLIVNQFNILEQLGNISIILSTLVRTKSKEFHKILEERKDKFQFDKKYAPRVFIEDYIDIS